MLDQDTCYYVLLLLKRKLLSNVGGKVLVY